MNCNIMVLPLNIDDIFNYSKRIYGHGLCSLFIDINSFGFMVWKNLMWTLIFVFLFNLQNFKFFIELYMAMLKTYLQFQLTQ